MSLLWSYKTTETSSSWLSVTYGKGIFVAVGNYGSGNRVMTSPDGITWTTQLSAQDNTWEGVTFGNDLFVAVSSNGTARVMISSNGINWISVTVPNQNWRDVTYGHDRFVAVGANGRSMSSLDGENWTLGVQDYLVRSWRRVTYGNGVFVAVTDSVPFGAALLVQTSTDGVNWSYQTAVKNVYWSAVAYGNGVFVAGGVGASGSTNSIMYSSNNGVNWTSVITPVDSNFNSIIYGNSKFIAIGQSGHYAMSNNGITWTFGSMPTNVWRSLAYNKLKTIVAVGATLDTSNVLYTQFVPTLTNFSIPIKLFGDGPFTIVTPTSDSTGEITYSSSNTAVASVSGNMVTIVGAGISVITASQEPTATFDTGSITASLLVLGDTDTGFRYSDNTFTLSSDTIISQSSYNVPIGHVLVDVIFGAMVQTIETNAFLNSSGLSSIKIPSSVTELKANCFANCSGLTRVIFQDQGNITLHDESAFASCTNLQNVIYLGTLTYRSLTPLAFSRQSSFPNYATQGFFIYDSSCFMEGTLILSLNKQFDEEWVPVEQLRKGDLVKTYMHGYRKIQMIGKGFGINVEKESFCNMYKRKESIDGFQPLHITGWHAVLVDETRDKNLKLSRDVKIDDKYLLMAGHSPDFEELELETKFTCYNFVVEPNHNVEQRFGVWANGILCETPNKRLHLKHDYIN